MFTFSRSFELNFSYSSELGIPFFETSAKYGMNVEKAFHKLIREMHSIFGNERLAEKDQESAAHLNVTHQSKENCQC